ncbi:3,4-dihydroxy 2-butanone 4-phosphate synthase [Pedobacter cryoconitis]|uniref:3,4-dihydroxy-2-butanone 4-phosphate synthase n=1 Tax=Pedobacter cryoconitis TaxID=188932 RepID=A0A7W8ZR68_9SPHI|nr:3,4-dihydroxy-2-butanone-4-phosphate synthase [Pedobacter cryoconitis]MBB5638718.1 3,4-dihydroxy 2-butanone 4-phosphate synthase [Pedobacter cryoconitis]
MNSYLTYFGKDHKERVNKAISYLQAGKGILLVDDENRENEGDLIFSAEKISVKDMALMIRSCSGIVCLCLTPEKAGSLALNPMVNHNTSRYQTAFTVSIEAASGVTTGVSAADRLHTIQTACKPGALPEDLSRPGHVFPLIANKAGVFGRRGHTEGSVDLMQLAGMSPAAVLCELTNEDGTMSRLREISEFAICHAFTVVSIEDIAQYRKHLEELQPQEQAVLN